ncbi:MAG: GLPGLI family protein [Niastella sp.]|uniref:GLPGLI family protein n=1 Tax=Niastella sp. TaxID=1869183 RepID=UPI00389ADF63
MKKQLLLAVGLLTACIGAEAQKPDTAWLMVHYKFTHIMDTTKRPLTRTFNMVLFVGKNASAYKSYDQLVADQQFKKVYAEAVASSPDGQPRGINRTGIGSPTQYFQYPGENKLFTKDYVMVNAYLIEAAMPAINWTISNDTATFGGLHCQKATGHFKGRDYIVWFCPDLPVHTGPWKLNGLPGVIVDARDTKNEVVFAFDGVEKTVPSPPKGQRIGGNTDEKDLPPILQGLNDDHNLIQPPAQAIKTTQKEFDKLRAAMEKNPEAFAQAINAAIDRGDKPNSDHVMVRRRPNGDSGPVMNNPIELPEK